MVDVMNDGARRCIASIVGSLFLVADELGLYQPSVKVNRYEGRHCFDFSFGGEHDGGSIVQSFDTMAMIASPSAMVHVIMSDMIRSLSTVVGKPLEVSSAVGSDIDA